MRSKVTWLSRQLFQGPYLTLVTNQKQFEKARPPTLWTQRTDGLEAEMEAYKEMI